jgi:minor histocompatibility antigen H13
MEGEDVLLESLPVLAENASGMENATNNTAVRFEASAEGMAMAYISLLCMALFPIVIGAMQSVKHVTKQKLAGRPDEVETLTSKDAMMFPVYGSAVLFGIYLIFRFIDKAYVNILFTVYFFAIGVVAVTRLLEPIVKRFVPLPFANISYKLLLLSDEEPTPTEAAKEEGSVAAIDTENQKTLVSAISSVLNGDVPQTEDQPGRQVYRDLVMNYSFDYHTVVALLLGAVFGIWYMLKKHWIANNVFGLAFSISGVEFLQLNSVTNGCILLSGLFFYDVFWVFGTDVMVTVAKSFEAPIKLIFPQDLPEKGLDAGNFAMLGLGDIVIPGIFIALLLRVDHSMAKGGKVKRTYFYTSFIAYILGLLMTIGVMHHFKAAQPALLYLVPSCLGLPLLVALIRGELKPLFAYLDNPEVPEEKVEKTD